MSCLDCWKAELTRWEKVRLYVFGDRRLIAALSLMVTIQTQRAYLGLGTPYEWHRDEFVRTGNEKEFQRMLRHVPSEEVK